MSKTNARSGACFEADRDLTEGRSRGRANAFPARGVVYDPWLEAKTFEILALNQISQVGPKRSLDGKTQP